MIKNALGYLILMFFFLMIFSCGAKSEKTKIEKRDDSAIIRALNANNYEHALLLIEKELALDPKNLELSYLKVQALSEKASIDIYSLFPIVKMKLFDVAMTEWSDINKYTKKSQDDLQEAITEGGTVSSIDELDANEEKIKSTPLETITYTTAIEIQIGEDKYEKTTESYDVYGNSNAVTSTYFQKMCWATIIIESPLFFGMDRYFEYVGGQVDNSSSQADNCKEILGPQLEAFPENEQNLKREIKRAALQMIDHRRIQLDKKKNGEQIIKLAYALFESIPIIKKVPDLEDKNAEIVYTALELLENIRQKTRREERLGKNGRQQIGLLAGYLILGSIKESLFLEEINAPTDLLCQIRAEKVIKNYKNFLTGFRYLFNVIIESKISKKTKKRMMDVKADLDNAPEELEDDQKDNIHEFVEDISDD